MFLSKGKMFSTKRGRQKSSTVQDLPVFLLRRSAGIVLAVLLVVFPVAPLLVSATGEPVRARHAMVVTDEDHATRVGLRILKDGGNAVDAAIAVGFALAVTYPRAGNLGGGGFMLVRLRDGGSTFFDFRERAPSASTRDMYFEKARDSLQGSIVGYRAAGVPGTVRGFDLAWRKFGSKPWAELVRPAKELAEEGFPVSHSLARSLRGARAKLEKFPESRRIFLRDGRFFEAGDRLLQPELGATLGRIAEAGADGFYEGPTAELLSADMSRNDGLITKQDLGSYVAVERQPLRGSYRGYEILSAPPPSSGGAGVIQMLNMLEGTGYENAGVGSPAAIHRVGEMMRLYFADRAAYFGDPDYAEIPLARLLSKEYAAERRAMIDPESITPSSTIGAGKVIAYESSDTTHYSIVDAEGNAVAVTYTLNSAYGSGVTAAETGVLLNNEMDDFTIRPGQPNQFGLLQSENNTIEPGKRPLSSMTPTIVVYNDKPFLVLGAAGGPRIISTVLQVILNVIDFKMDVRQAIEWPRFHHQWMPDQLEVERLGFSPDTLELLRKRGHVLNVRGGIANGHAIHIDADAGWLFGAPDSRSHGTARGY